MRVQYTSKFKAYQAAFKLGETADVNGTVDFPINCKRDADEYVRSAEKVVDLMRAALQEVKEALPTLKEFERLITLLTQANGVNQSQVCLSDINKLKRLQQLV